MAAPFFDRCCSRGRRVPKVAGEEADEGTVQGSLRVLGSTRGTTTPEAAMKASCFSMETAMEWMPAGESLERGNSRI